MIDNLPGAILIPLNEIPDDALLDIIEKINIPVSILDLIFEAGKRNILHPQVNGVH